MLRHFFIFASLIVIAILNTGCLSAQYNQDYISKNIKPELKKVDKNICINETSSIDIMNGQVEDNVGNAVDYHIKDINKNVAIKYFKQYFNNVNESSKECFITINTSIPYIDGKMISPDGMDATFELEIEVMKDNKLIDTFSTKETYSSDVFITFALLGLSAPYKTSNEAFHKGLLDIYETKFELNLLKALKENI